MAFFTIITCTYNSEEYLLESIASVEAQSNNDYEHIFIDAFSVDRTVKIIEEYRNRNPGKVQLIQRLPTGISDAMNFGVKHATGDVIVHLHSDDAMAVGALSAVRGCFDVGNYSIVIGNCRLLKSDSFDYTWPLVGWRLRLLKSLFMPLMFFTNLIAHPSTYIKRSVFDRHGYFDDNYKVVMDYDYWFRVLRHEPVFLVDEVLSIYRFHSETASTKLHVRSLKEIDEIRSKYKWRYPISYFVFLIVLSPFLVLRRYFKK
jgi:glycosyltransferase involved in cell wall biosynthesis